MNRRRFLSAAASGGVALAGGGALAPLAAAATDDELAYANFGAATELLLQDFYGRIGEAKLFSGQLARAFTRGRLAAGEHAAALAALLTGAGQAAPLKEDFEFAWPAGTFTARGPAATTGSTVAEALLGAYLTAAATSPTGSFRVLYASLGASLGEQLSTLSLARAPRSETRSPQPWISSPPARRSSASSADKPDRRLNVRRPGPFLIAAALAGAALLAGSAAARPHQDPLTIYAAASLTEVFRTLDPAPRYNFGASNALETQLRQGAPADVFASAAPLNTQNLFKAGLVEKPVTFTANRLALIVPRSNPAGIRSVYDLRSKPAKLVIAAEAVPVGGYTRTVLRRLGLSSVLTKVVSQESDVKAVVGKIALGQGDAGFVYATDARPVSDQVTVVRIPAWAQPRVRYEIAVVSRSPNKAAARRWIRTLLAAKGQNALKNAGFLPLPEVTP